MESKVNYTLVGIFVVVFTVLFFVFAIWLSEYRDEKSYKTYLVYMNEPASGLAPNSRVEYNGVEVGYVAKIGLNYYDLQQVKLKLKIESKVPITTATVATLISQGLTGITYVGLKTTQPGAPLLEPAPGKRLRVIPWEPSFVTKLSDAIANVSTSIKNIGISVDRVLDKQNAEAIKNSLSNIEKITSTLEQNTQQMDHIIKNADTVFSNTATASKKLPDVMTNLDKGLKSFDRTSTAVHEASVEFKRAIGDSRGLVNQLSTQTVPSATQLMNELNRTARNISRLSEDVRQNPAMVIRGRTPPPPGPGEIAR